MNIVTVTRVGNSSVVVTVDDKSVTYTYRRLAKTKCGEWCIDSADKGACLDRAYGILMASPHWWVRSIPEIDL